MTYEDITRTCIDCIAAGEPATFIWTAGEQKFYSQRGFVPPKRCARHRALRKERTTAWTRHDADDRSPTA
jgi:putative zinc ribbon protein